MKTRKIFKITNKLVWDTIWFGFWILLIVALVSKPDMFYQTYYYSEGYSNPHIVAQKEFNAPEGAIELTPDSPIVKFYNDITMRVEFLRISLLIYFVIMILINYRKQIISSLETEHQKQWRDFETKYDKVIDKIKETIRW